MVKFSNSSMVRIRGNNLFGSPLVEKEDKICVNSPLRCVKFDGFQCHPGRNVKQTVDWCGVCEEFHRGLCG